MKILPQKSHLRRMPPPIEWHLSRDIDKFDILMVSHEYDIIVGSTQSNITH